MDSTAMDSAAMDSAVSYGAAGYGTASYGAASYGAARDAAPGGRPERTRRFFAEPVRELALAVYGSAPGRPVGVLQAGCLAPLHELGLGELAQVGFEIAVSLVDVDDPLVKTVLRRTRDTYEDVIIGDLRTVPLPPRGYDVVYCGHLLERVPHMDLVLDRLVSALRPGGLLLIRATDSACAWSLLDRWLPAVARRRIWRQFYPGEPGPFPAIHESTVSERGIPAYALMRGLVIAQRSAERTLPDTPRRLATAVRVTCTVISRLSRGRFASTREELLYVIRKPEDRFARVVGG